MRLFLFLLVLLEGFALQTGSASARDDGGFGTGGFSNKAPAALTEPATTTTLEGLQLEALEPAAGGDENKEKTFEKNPVPQDMGLDAPKNGQSAPRE